MIYVLDTNTVSALMGADEAPLARLAGESRLKVFVPQPVVAELACGIARLRATKRRKRLEEAFEGILAHLRRADWTDDVSRKLGEIKSKLEHRGERIEDFDIAIAAHALAYEATLVTSNRRHMSRVSQLQTEDWIGPSRPD